MEIEAPSDSEYENKFKLFSNLLRKNIIVCLAPQQYINHGLKQNMLCFNNILKFSCIAYWLIRCEHGVQIPSQISKREMKKKNSSATSSRQFSGKKKIYN